MARTGERYSPRTGYGKLDDGELRGGVGEFSGLYDGLELASGWAELGGEA